MQSLAVATWAWTAPRRVESEGLGTLCLLAPDERRREGAAGAGRSAEVNPGADGPVTVWCSGVVVRWCGGAVVRWCGGAAEDGGWCGVSSVACGLWSLEF